MKIKNWILAAEFAAVIAIFAQLVLPLASIPLTGQTFAVGLTATILDRKTSTWSVFLYLLLGLIGLPVFAGGNAGIAVFFGPTGGFLIGFLVNTWLTGSWLEKFGYTQVQSLLANLVGAMATLFFGSIWLWLVLVNSFQQAFLLGMSSFILPGIIKAILAGILGLTIRKALIHAKLLTP